MCCYYYYLYKITNLLSGKVYIGQSIKEKERWRQHKYFGRNPERTGQYIHRAMAKYGIENFTYEVIAMCKTLEDAAETEIILIEQYNSRDNRYGYNLAPGGNVTWISGLPSECYPMYGKHHSEESKKKISESNIGKILPPHTDEWKHNMSIIFSGRTLTDDWKEKISESNKGKKRSEETRKKISEYRTGKIYSSETREKMSLASLGKVKSEETKQRMSKARSGEGGSNAKLTWEIVNKIRLDYESGKFTQQQLAERYSVKRTAISYIINNRTWRI